MNGRRKAGRARGASIPAAYLVTHSGNELLRAQQIEPLSAPNDYRLHVHSCRQRPVDGDGISAKAAIDGFVHAGLFEDDNASIIKQVSYSQETAQAEETVIEIWEQTR